jgi:hypothetical protein
MKKQNKIRKYKEVAKTIFYLSILFLIWTGISMEFLKWFSNHTETKLKEKLKN